MSRQWKSHVCRHPSLPPALFPNCSLSERVGSLLCAAHSILPWWGISIFKKKRQNTNVEYCAEHPSSCGTALKALWYRLTHTHRSTYTLGECHQLPLFCRLIVHLCLVGTHCYTLLWQPSSIVDQILWDVCTKQLYFCSLNKLTSLQICSSQLQKAMYKSMPWWARERAVIFTLFPS